MTTPPPHFAPKMPYDEVRNEGPCPSRWTRSPRRTALPPNSCAESSAVVGHCARSRYLQPACPERFPCNCRVLVQCADCCPPRTPQEGLGGRGLRQGTRGHAYRRGERHGRRQGHADGTPLEYTRLLLNSHSNRPVERKQKRARPFFLFVSSGIWKALFRN